MMAKKTGSNALVGLGGKREAVTKNAGLLQPRPLTRLPNNSKVRVIHAPSFSLLTSYTMRL